MINNEKVTPPNNYVCLLWSLLGMLAFMPFRAMQFELAEILFSIMHSIVVISALATCWKKPRIFLLLCCISLPAIGANWAGVSATYRIEYISLSLTCLFYASVIAIATADMLTSREVNKHILAGSLSIYLLSGLVFAGLYTILQMNDPNMFLLPDVQKISGMESLPGDPQSKYLLPTFMYHSFVTLSTLGYGDIQPQTFSARFLCIAQAMIGQIYLVVVVAGIVGLKAASFFQNEEK